MKKIYLIVLAFLLSFTSYAQIGPITGTFSICVGATTTLSCTPPGGTWSSSNTGIASIGSTSGVVTGVSAGVVTITYTGIGAFTTASFTVNPLPGPIACPATSGCSVCPGDSIQLTDPTPGGTWSSSTPSVATVGSTSGWVTGVSSGTTTITYTLPTGCYVTQTITVNTAPASFTMTGGGSYCAGGPGLLVGLSGSQVGTMYQLLCGGSPVGSPVAGTGSAISFGLQTAGCVYTVQAFIPGFVCRTTMGSVTITVNPSPGPITCPSSGCSVCVGASIPLVNAVPGGTWTSSNPAVGSIGSTSGILTGITPGIITITYTLPGGCFVTTTVTVNANPGAITGTTTMCVGATTTLSCTPPGGTWSSSNAGIATVGSSSGVVTGITAGTATITYTLPTGCYSTTTVTVNPNPSIITSGLPGVHLCAGTTLTLTGSPTGGTWTSNNTGIATIGSASGVLTGITAGTTTITYTLSTGCYATAMVTVDPAAGAITGPTTVCVGSTTTLGCTPPGGTWTSGNISIATIGSTSGVVTGVAAGTTTITYTTSAGCTSVTTITVNPTPVVGGISGGIHVCVGGTMTLTGSPTGGTWTSGNITIATVGSASGVVTGVTPGTTTVTYTLPTGCFVTITVTVNPNPGPITGILSVCVGSTTTLSCSPPGGTWTSANPFVANVSPSGVVTGVAAGVVTITYTAIPSGCIATANVTVNALPVISGTLSTCVGATTTLAGTPPGGTWTSSNPSVGVVGSSSGVVTGVTAGTTTIVYTLPNGCATSVTVTVTPAPLPITCPSTGCMVCQGSTITLTDPMPGGTWSSSNTGIATVGSSSGVVTGITPGVTVISYTLGGCTVTTLVTVNPVPIAFNVTGGGSYCSGGSGVLVGLSGSQIGVNYQLFCAMSPVGSPVPGTGSAITFGLQTSGCTYTVVGTNSFGCTTTMTGSVTVTVNPSPGPITCPIGGCTVCQNWTITLTNSMPGGTWTSSNTGIATIGSSSGIVTGVTPGTTVITYTLPNGCSTSVTVTVTPHPCGVGIGENTLAQEGIELYPNPAHDELIIKAEAGDFLSYSLTNTVGQQLIQQKMNGKETPVNVKSLPPAVYYITVRGERGVVVRKFVKQ